MHVHFEGKDGRQKMGVINAQQFDLYIGQSKPAFMIQAARLHGDADCFYFRCTIKYGKVRMVIIAKHPISREICLQNFVR